MVGIKTCHFYFYFCEYYKVQIDKSYRIWYNVYIKIYIKEVFKIGSVKVDIYRAERQFDLINFSDFDCIKGLIKNRHIVDSYRGIEIDRDIYTASDVHPMNPAIIILYVTLDELLNQCQLNDKQKSIIEKLMDGYTEQDIAELLNQEVYGITKVLNLVCKRVVEINTRNWLYNDIYMNHIKATFQYKKCSECGDNKPLTPDFYYADVLSKDGFKNKCRSCIGKQ